MIEWIFHLHKIIDAPYYYVAKKIYLIKNHKSQVISDSIKF